MKRTIKRTLVSFLIFVFSLAPVSPQALLNIDISHAKAISPEDATLSNITEDILIPVGKKFVIEAGSLLNFNEYHVKIIVEGELQINGTKEDPVIIKRINRGSFSIETKPGSKLSINNAHISGGGYIPSSVRGFTQKALASEFYAGAIQNGGGDIVIKNTTFENNQIAFVSEDNYVGSLNVNGCKFIGNIYTDVSDYNSKSNFQFNYWKVYSNTTACINNPSVENCLPLSSGNFDFSNRQTNINFVYIEGAS
ncbi:MAG: hypothetical protein RBS77_05240, partial [Candidatus Moranbacteria bacterium]|nr:hypothetical protein [Candidatus Moranbacteria bacterium]